jgi:hypothetical protein
MKVLLALLLFCAAAVQAQDYPNKPIRILVPFAPGGAVDTAARVLAVNPALFDNVPYELERDFAPITRVSDAGEGQARLDQLRLGGQRQHRPPRGRVAGAGRRHPAPARAVQGRRAGRGRGGGGRRALRRDGGAGRAAAHQVRARQGDRHHHREEIAPRSLVRDAARRRHPGLDASIWVGLFAPKGTPQPVVDRLNREVRTTLSDADVKRRFVDTGAEAVGMSPAEFLARIKSDAERYGRVIQKAGVKPG